MSSDQNTAKARYGAREFLQGAMKKRIEAQKRHGDAALDLLFDLMKEPQPDPARLEFARELAEHFLGPAPTGDLLGSRKAAVPETPAEKAMRIRNEVRRNPKAGRGNS